MTITLGRWQAAALVASVLVLVVLAVVLGFLLATLTMAGRSAVPVAASASAPAAGTPSVGNDLGGNLRKRLTQNYEVEMGIKEAADQVSDAAGTGADLAIDPLAHGASAAAHRLLPSWMAGHVDALSQKAAYRVKERIVFGTENTVEDRLGNVVSNMGEGAADAVPVRRYAIELGRFATSSNAESFAAAAARRGIVSTVEYAPEPGQPSPYAVRTGRYAAPEEASSALDALARSSGIAGTVVTLAEAGGRANP